MGGADNVVRRVMLRGFRASLGSGFVYHNLGFAVVF